VTENYCFAYGSAVTMLEAGPALEIHEADMLDVPPLVRRAKQLKYDTLNFCHFDRMVDI